MREDTAQKRRRGRPARDEPRKPSGFRITEGQRRLVDIARAFIPADSSQEVLDHALNEYLQNLRRTNVRFSDAAAALDAQIAEEKRQVTPITSRTRSS